MVNILKFGRKKSCRCFCVVLREEREARVARRPTKFSVVSYCSQRRILECKSDKVLNLALLCDEMVWGSEGKSPRILSLALDEE